MAQLSYPALVGKGLYFKKGEDKLILGWIHVMGYHSTLGVSKVQWNMLRSALFVAETDQLVLHNIFSKMVY